jgi:deazaflavin-dependent oxidoreductase (nitroreductase family)
MSEFNREVIKEFRANDGRVGGMFEGAPLILLTTTGARTGKMHTTPTVYAEDAGRLIIFASNAGRPTTPAWLHNLRTRPEVVVELGSIRFDAVATEITGPERDRLYADQVARDPAFAAYQQATSRVIQVVALIPTRLGAAATQLREIHAGLRRKLDDVRAAVDAYLDGEPLTLQAPPADLRNHCLSFCESLHAHHSREDSVFPRLAADFPDLKPSLQRLQREHETVATLNTALRETLDRLSTSPSRAEAGELRDQVIRLTADLETHYLYEELHLGAGLDRAAA